MRLSYVHVKYTFTVKCILDAHSVASCQKNHWIALSSYTVIHSCWFSLLMRVSLKLNVLIVMQFSGGGGYIVQDKANTPPVNHGQVYKLV